MKPVKPVVVRMGDTVVNREALRKLHKTIGGSDAGRDRFLGSHGTDGKPLIEFAGRVCYESYEPRLNPNVTRIREDPSEYFKNILVRGDGSIMEHSQVSFALLRVSRGCSHEIVRHRVGTAVSQESLRYVRPPQIKFWIPEELDEDQRQAMANAVDEAEKAYRDL